ncbi:MAG: site-specific integrase [Pseudomonadota bacterium]
MAKLSPTTETVLDGDVRLTRRGGSSAWQAAFKIGDRWVRVTTRCRQLTEAKAAAKDLYLEYKFKDKHDLPIVTKRFDAVAALVVADLRKQLEAGVGKKVFKDYITAIETYLIPFFGTKHVNNVSFTELKEFAVWRATKMKREPKASTITTHNTALNRVFEEAVNRGYMSKSKIPILVNAGDDGERRPDFDLDAYRSLVRKLPNWAKDDTVHTQKSRDMRMLLWDYVIVLANSGIRHGTEAENLRWRQVHVWEEKGRVYLELQGVKGKTRVHNTICRPSAIAALRRIHARTHSIAGTDFEVMLKQRLTLGATPLYAVTVEEDLQEAVSLMGELQACLAGGLGSAGITPSPEDMAAVRLILVQVDQDLRMADLLVHKKGRTPQEELLLNAWTQGGLAMLKVAEAYRVEHGY